jgi:hypothetical protein
MMFFSISSHRQHHANPFLLLLHFFFLSLPFNLIQSIARSKKFSSSSIAAAAAVVFIILVYFIFLHYIHLAGFFKER